MNRSLPVVFAVLFTLSSAVEAQVPVAQQLGLNLWTGCGGAVDESSRCSRIAVANVGDTDSSHYIISPASVGPESYLTWAPDGRAFATDGNRSITITRVTGSTRTTFPQVGYVDAAPAWSPDGTKIAFVSSPDWNAGKLYVMNADGSNVRLVTSDIFAARHQPSWSPDSTRLAFTCADTSTSQSDICTINLDGSGLLRLTADPASDYDPAWSRDGATILFASERFSTFPVYPDTPMPELALMNAADGSGVIRIAPDVMAYAADWSPDGTQIVFQNYDPDSNLGFGPTYQSYVMNANGTSVTYLGDASSPKWRPMTGVGVNYAPVAAFSSSCVQQTCTFDGTVSSDSDGSVVEWGWQFTDGGTTAGGATPTHTFPGPAIYSITLIAMDNAGALAKVSQTVDLDPNPPVASFTYSCTGLTCTFDASASYDPDEPLNFFSWEFGDQRSGNSRTTTHTYAAASTYNVTLTVRDAAGKTSTMTKTIAFTNNPPVASFTATCNSLACSFDGNASSDTDGQIGAWMWNFGDGTTAGGNVVSHAYAAYGTYNVTLTVQDTGFATGSTTKSVALTPNNPPVASFTFTCNALTCSFNGTASSDSDGQITDSIWTFGDGTFVGPNLIPSHTYAAYGSYSVTLSVRDNNLASGSVTKVVTLTNNPPVASFTATCSSLTCSFDGSASTDSDGAIGDWAWTFGDGTTAHGNAVSHTYTAYGSYSVSLTVIDNGSATASLTKTVTLTKPPILMHSGDLDGVVEKTPPTWKATVTVTIHDGAHAAVANVTVVGSWSTGPASSCVTNAAGQCAMSLASISQKTTVVTMTVQSVTQSQYDYVPTANHDPDGDSNGTAITLKKP